MAEEQQNLSEEPTEEIKPEVAAFKEEVAKADGTLLPLRRTTTDEKKLYLATRVINKPEAEGDESGGANKWFWGWGEQRLPMTGVLLVDVYVDENGKIIPLGHQDWWIDGDYANGGGNMHEAALPRNEPQELSKKRWHQYDYTAFKVDYGYHRQRVGSLMVAASAIALSGLGVKRFYTGVLLKPAEKTFENFGIKKTDFPHNEDYKKASLPIERLSNHPQVDKIIGEFV